MPGPGDESPSTAGPNHDRLHREAGDRATNHHQGPPRCHRVHRMSHISKQRSKSKEALPAARSAPVPHRDTRPDPTRSSHPPFQTSPEPPRAARNPPSTQWSEHETLPRSGNERGPTMNLKMGTRDRIMARLARHEEGPSVTCIGTERGRAGQRVVGRR